MSTKNYTGIQIKHMDIIELNKYIMEVRKQLKPIARKEFCKAFAKVVEELVVYIQTGIQLADNVDEYEFTNKTPDGVVDYANKIVNKIIKNNKSAVTIMEHKSDFNFDVKICVFPIYRKLLGMYFIDNEALREAFLALPEISDYSYWNNVDRPEDISEAAWRRRGANWDIALPGIGIPSECGFQYEIIQSDFHASRYMYSAKDVIPYLGDQDALKQRVARNKVYHDEFQRLRTEDPNADPMKTYFKAMDYMKDHPELVENAANALTLDVVGFLSQE